MEVIPITSNETLVLSDDALFENMYESAFPGVARFVSKMHGSFQDAKDTFHDALVIYMEKRASCELQVYTSEEAYVIGIARHVWLRKLRGTNREVSLDTFEHSLSIPEKRTESPDQERLLLVLERTGKKCLELLLAWYYDQMGGKDVVETLGYSNEHAAAVQKYKCMEKVRNVIKQKSMRYGDFFN